MLPSLFGNDLREARRDRVFRKVPGKVDGAHMESQNYACLRSSFVPAIVSICSPCEILIVCVDAIF